MTAAGVAMIVVSLCGILLAFQAMQHGWFLAGYFGGAVCGDVLIWGVLIVAALWLPGRRATA